MSEPKDKPQSQSTLMSRVKARAGKPTTQEHWTDSVRINKRFLQTLFEATHAQNKGRVTNQQAYLLYWLYHTDVTQPQHYKLGQELSDPFMQANVRNQLCKLEHEGLLIRVQPGTYKWPKGIHEKIQGRVNPRKLRL